MSKEDAEKLLQQMMHKIDELERLLNRSGVVDIPEEKVTIIDDTTFLPKEGDDND